jgi:hypothetical protein
MFHTKKSLFERFLTPNWKRALLGGALAITPAMVMAGDNDKDKDKNRSDRRGNAASMRQVDGPKMPQTMTPQQPIIRQDKSHDGPDRKTLNSVELKRPELPGAGDRNLGIPNGAGFKRGTVDENENKKLRLPTDRLGDSKGIDPKIVDSKPLDPNRPAAKFGRPVEPRDKNPRVDLPKIPDLNQNKPKPGDGHLAHDGDKHDGDKHNNFKHDDVKDDKKGHDFKQGENFLDQHQSGKFDGVVKGAVAKKLDLGKQFELKHKGDLTLKLNLAQKINVHGGWKKAHWAGLIGPGFGAGCSPIVYCGPGYFPSHCLYPTWSPWVEFCWGFRCDPICDPRPWFCRPWVCTPCPTWVWWEYPVWYEMPVVACGTWVDVEPVAVSDGLDLQLLAVRFVDPGQPELGQGPRYRIWARNNSARTIVQDFNVLLLAANGRQAGAGLPQAGVRVDAIAPGEIKAFDVRLPIEATTMGRDATGNAVPFSQLHVLVDSHREIPEVFEENNGAVLARGDILPVDPVIFGTDSVAPLAGSEINIAGEGFGPEPGQVLVHVGGIELQAEIEGWYDLGVRVRLPSLALASPTQAELILVRGDTAASNPSTIQLTVPVASR